MSGKNLYPIAGKIELFYNTKIHCSGGIICPTGNPLNDNENLALKLMYISCLLDGQTCDLEKGLADKTLGKHKNNSDDKIEISDENK